MRTLNFHCRYCDAASKIILEDVELTADGSTVEGMCQICFEAYQGGHLADSGNQLANVALGVHDVQPEDTGRAGSGRGGTKDFHPLRNQK